MEEKSQYDTILINFIGQPSSGKTSLSAKLFARLKELELDVEYTSEYVKGWAWEGRTVGKFDQFYIFGKETHNQSKLFGKVEFVISDSPVMLTSFYHYYYNNDNALREACKDFYRMTDEEGIKVLNFFLPRKKKYNPKGRFQTQEQADQLAKDLLKWLDTEEYPYEILDCSEKERLEKVLERIKEVREGIITND